MTAAADFSEIPPFVLFAGRNGQTVPFVFNSPHSGRHYPPRFLAMSRLDPLSIRRSEDCYVDELFSGALDVGATFLCANFPRAYLDANREPWELDPRMFRERVPPYANTHSPRVMGGLGTLPRLVADGMDIYRHRLPLEEAMSRIEHYYMPYHATLRDLLYRTRTRFGHAILIDCHSMPSTIRTPQGNMSPDIVVGDRFGTSASSDLSRLAVSLLAARGFAVEQNRPYAGGFITEHYGRPAQDVHALQIEVNRGLYLDDDTLERSDGFELLRQQLSEFIADLVSFSADILPSRPMAAE